MKLQYLGAAVFLLIKNLICHKIPLKITELYVILCFFELFFIIILERLKKICYNQ